MPDVPDIIRIRTTLTSDTPHLPTLAPLIGREVEIVVAPEPVARPPADDRLPTADELAVREAAMAELRNSPDYDWDSWRVQRAFDHGVAFEELRRFQEEQRHEGQS